MPRNIDEILRCCVGPYDRYCSSCGLGSGACYISTPLIGIGKTVVEGDADNRLLDSIVAFDRAEASSANITQTNLIAVSSFNGLNGALLGYDLLAQPGRPHPLLAECGGVPVYDAEPLFAATRALYGTIDDPHFPIAPGQHTVCAYKSRYEVGPVRLYGALAIGIAEDRGRNADLFMEDHGLLYGEGSEAAVLQRLARSVRRIGENLSLRYQAIFIGLHSIDVEAGEIGCVLTAAPYVHLARHAVLPHGPELLRSMTLHEWLDAMRPEFLQSTHHMQTQNVSSLP